MKRRLTQVLGGALVLTMFGCCWGAYGAYALGGSDRPWIPAVPVVLTMIMFVSLTRLQRRIEALPADSSDAEAERREARGRKIFAGVNLAQALAILAAIQVCRSLGHAEYQAPAIAVIVGAHFLVLAAPMQLPSYNVVGGLLAMAGLGTLFAVPGELQGLVLGLAAAAILWVAALQRFHEVYSAL
jgi:hypothetical protein